MRNYVMPALLGILLHTQTIQAADKSSCYNGNQISLIQSESCMTQDQFETYLDRFMIGMTNPGDQFVTPEYVKNLPFFEQKLNQDMRYAYWVLENNYTKDFNLSDAFFEKIKNKTDKGDALSDVVLGLGIQKKLFQGDETSFFKLLYCAALSSCQVGQYHLGILYKENMNTYGYNEAFLWFTRASDHGNVNALFELAKCYEEGVGVNIDRDKALQLYLKAADLGEVKSQKKLGDYYKKGSSWLFGPSEDELKKAYRYYKKAAVRGDRDGIFFCTHYMLSNMSHSLDGEFINNLWGQLEINESAWYALCAIFRESFCRDYTEKSIPWNKEGLFLCDQRAYTLIDFFQIVTYKKIPIRYPFCSTSLSQEQYLNSLKLINELALWYEGEYQGSYEREKAVFWTRFMAIKWPHFQKHYGTSDEVLLAMNRLVRYYRVGMGVKRDQKIADKWAQEAKDYLELSQATKISEAKIYGNKKED